MVAAERGVVGGGLGGTSSHAAGQLTQLRVESTGSLVFSLPTETDLYCAEIKPDLTEFFLVTYQCVP